MRQGCTDRGAMGAPVPQLRGPRWQCRECGGYTQAFTLAQARRRLTAPCSAWDPAHEPVPIQDAQRTTLDSFEAVIG